MSLEDDKRRAIANGSRPLCQQPDKMPGDEIRQIRVRQGEARQDAIARAKLLPWWSKVVRKAPRQSGGFWFWVVRGA